jgi:hypothetical protein
MLTDSVVAAGVALLGHCIWYSLHNGALTGDTVSGTLTCYLGIYLDNYFSDFVPARSLFFSFVPS